MAGFADMADEVRSHVHAIENHLGRQTDLLHDLANKPPESVKLTRLHVLSEAQLRTQAVEENVNVLVLRAVPGSYVKLNHWAAQLVAEGEVALFYGNDNQQSLLDIPVPVKSVRMKSGPNELIIPPEHNIYAQATKAGVVTLAVTSYQLSS